MTSSSAETRRSPVSIAETVWRSLKPNRRARSSCESFRSSRNALIRVPIKLVVMAASADGYNLAKCKLQDYIAFSESHPPSDAGNDRGEKVDSHGKQPQH